MDIFQSVFLKLLPLYGIMALGFFYGRRHPDAAKTVASLVLFWLMPPVIVAMMANLAFDVRYLALPFVTFALCCATGAIAKLISRRLWPDDNTPNLLGFIGGLANTGYFGFPLVLAVMPLDKLGIYMMGMLGFTMFECSLGYYTLVRSHCSVMDSLKRVARLPGPYAFAAGIALGAMGLHVPDFAMSAVKDMTGCYITLGSLMIGLALARLDTIAFEPALMAVAGGVKFLVWPFLTFALMGLDALGPKILTSDMQTALVLFSVLPFPANSTAYAIHVGVQPERAATLVFLSTVLALFYAPFIVALWR